MTQQEIPQEFIFKMLEIVSTCDNEMRAAYEKRNKLLTELNEWVIESWKEA
jgi:hypothetical protein